MNNILWDSNVGQFQWENDNIYKAYTISSLKMNQPELLYKNEGN